MTEKRTVVVLPGRSFGPYIPQLYFPMFAAGRRGAEFVGMEWDESPPTDPAEIAPWVKRRVEPILSTLDPRSSLLIAKSLGTFASVVPSSRAIPAIWVTPVLTAPNVVEALGERTAPFMLVGGTSDRLWDPALARRLTDHVLEFEGADHGLFVPGPLGRSAQNVAALADEVETFIDEHVWPPPTLG